MYLERTHRLACWIGLWNRRILALVGALVLVLSAFVFADREARAQQLPQEEAQQQSVVVNRHTVVIDGEVVELAAAGVEEIPPVETPAAGPAASLAVRDEPGTRHEPEPASTVVRYEPVMSPEPAPKLPDDIEPSPDPATPGVKPEMDLVPTPELPVEPAPDPATPEVEPEGGLTPGPALEPTPEPAVFEENEPLPPSPAREAPAAVVVSAERTQPSSSLETEVSSALDTLQSAATNTWRDLTDGALFQPAEVLAGLSSGAGSAPADGRIGDTGSPSGGTEGPSRSATQQSSPFTLPPMGSGSFPPTGGDMGSGSVHLLLLCVLVSGLVLLWRDGGLSWGFWEPPKPSSALLLPLERPG